MIVKEKGDRWGIVVRLRRDTYREIVARGAFEQTVDDVVRKLVDLPPITKKGRTP